MIGPKSDQVPPSNQFEKRYIKDAFSGHKAEWSEVPSEELIPCPKCYRLVIGRETSFN